MGENLFIEEIKSILLETFLLSEELTRFENNTFFSVNHS